MKDKKMTERVAKPTLKRLLVINAVALLGLLAVTVVALWATGLLGSVIAFIF